MAVVPIFIEQSLSFSYDASINCHLATISPPQFILSDGGTYRVSWDGSMYVCTARFDNSLTSGTQALVLGDARLKNYPFAIIYSLSEQENRVVTSSTSATHDLAIYHTVEDTIIGKIDWLTSMQQTFEYYIVDPGTWKDIEKLENVKSSSIVRDSGVETLGSATINVSDSLGECYVRIYLVAIQNGVKEKHPLGTFLVQTPTSSFNGKIRNVTMDAYTPLLELKESPPPLGYFIAKGGDILDNAYLIAREHARAPVIAANKTEKLHSDFVANTNDTWLSFLIDLIANAKYSFMLDELGRILFAPQQETASLQPVWTYTDDNSSILYPDVTMDHDLYGIPNVVEVVYSRGDDHYYARVVNNDINSPISIPNRGREIIRRVTNPSLSGEPTENHVQEYAERLLRELSTLEYTITYTHAYCPVRLGDCVMLNYQRAGITGIKAKVISQTIKCEPGCPVTEKAVFTTKLWG